MKSKGPAAPFGAARRSPPARCRASADVPYSHVGQGRIDGRIRGGREDPSCQTPITPIRLSADEVGVPGEGEDPASRAPDVDERERGGRANGLGAEGEACAQSRAVQEGDVAHVDDDRATPSCTVYPVETALERWRRGDIDLAPHPDRRNTMTARLDTEERPRGVWLDVIRRRPTETFLMHRRSRGSDGTGALGLGAEDRRVGSSDADLEPTPNPWNLQSVCSERAHAAGGGWRGGA